MTKMPEPMVTKYDDAERTKVCARYYTEAQLRQAVRDALEEAAKTCDGFQARGVGMQPAECAGAIRAMKETI